MTSPGYSSTIGLGELCVWHISAGRAATPDSKKPATIANSIFELSAELVMKVNGCKDAGSVDEGGNKLESKLQCTAQSLPIEMTA